LTGGTIPCLLDEENEEACGMIISLIEKDYNSTSRIDLLKAYLRAFCIIITDRLVCRTPPLCKVCDSEPE